MYYIIIGLITLAGWAAGQLMILGGMVPAGIAVIIFSVLFGLGAYFRIWEIYSAEGRKIHGNTIQIVVASAALGFSVAGTLVLNTNPGQSLLFFVVSGFLLFTAKPAGEKFFDYFEVPASSLPMRKWEPWFVLALFAVSAWLRLYDLGNIPQVGHGGEGLVLSNSHMLASHGTPYTPHVGGGTDWPTLTYYMGIFFAKVFGWNIAGFRISSAVLGIISIISFYFLTRRLTSPLSAAITSLMYTVFISHLTTSRMYVPTLTLLFIPHIIALGILLAANKNPKWYFFLAAGLAAGYSLQGYVPGRGIFLLFIGWFILMFITRVKIFFTKKNFLLFWAGFFIVAGPVIIYAVLYPEMYWSYVNSVNPSRTGGMMAYVNMAKNAIPSFTAMFYTKSAWDVLFHFPYKPLFDPVTSVLFSSGFFLCVFAFWKPVPSILLILFLGGMIPGLLGGGSSIPPNTQRTLMTFPVIFIFCAYAFERLKRVYLGAGSKVLYYLLIAAGIAASGWSFQEGFREYFRFANSPDVRVNVGHHLYLMGREITKNPSAEVYLTPFFSGNDTFAVFIPPGKAIQMRKHIDDMLVLKPGADQLVMLDPFYTNTTGIFEKYFPNAKVTVHREAKELENAPYYTTLKLHPGGRRHVDEFVPYVFVTTIFIPKQDVADFQTSLVAVNGKEKERVKVFGGSDFGNFFAGKRVVLRGALLIPELGPLDVTSSEPVIFSNKWNGWKLTIDGREASFGTRIKVDSGIHFFELSGNVPAGQAGDLPVTVVREGIDMVSAGRVVAVGDVFGARTFHTPGANSFGKTAEYSRRVAAPNFRMYDGLFMSLPFCITEKAMMTVPESGEYEITGNEHNRFRITINGKEVFDNLAEPSIIKKEKIYLTKGVPVRMELRMAVFNAPIYTRALTVFVKGPGMKQAVMPPYDWFYPVD